MTTTNQLINNTTIAPYLKYYTIEILKAYAIVGDVDAQFKLGQYYEDIYINSRYVQYKYDKSTYETYNEAYRWYKLAAEHEHSEAQNAIGHYYFNWKNVEDNFEKAVKWWKLSAKNGCIEAQINLANCYEYGIGTSTNIIEAYKLYKFAAANNNSYAINKLLYFYIEHQDIINKCVNIQVYC